MAACGAFALIGFPLDDIWHRLFGQDVTLWGPTHLMLIGGAGMTLIGQAVLLAEGMRARAAARRARRAPRRGSPASPALRRVALMGGLLIGLSTFQAEFDFGVPQFRAVLQPFLIALAAGVALVAARVWIGRGGALGAALFFLAVRGAGRAARRPRARRDDAEPAALPRRGAGGRGRRAARSARRPLLLGAVGGLLAGTVGFADRVGVDPRRDDAAVGAGAAARGARRRRRRRHRGRRCSAR